MEPLHFLWKYGYFGYIRAVYADYVLELSGYVSVGWFVGVFVIVYVLELSVCLLVGLLGFVYVLELIECFGVGILDL